MKKLFDEIPCLENDRVILRPVAEGDAEALREMTLNPAVYRYLPTFLYEQQDPDIHAVIRGFYGDLFRKKQSLILAVCRKEAPETFCGLAEFYGFRNILHNTDSEADDRLSVHRDGYGACHREHHGGECCVGKGSGKERFSQNCPGSGGLGLSEADSRG